MRGKSEEEEQSEPSGRNQNQRKREVVIRLKPIHRISFDAPLSGAAPMTVPYTLFSDLAKKAQPPRASCAARRSTTTGFTASDRKECT